MSGKKIVSRSFCFVTIFLLLSSHFGVVPVSAGSESVETVYSNSTPITINTASGVSAPTKAALYPSQIVVSGMTGTVTRVSVTLTGLMYPKSGDLDFMLVSPGGQKFVFASDFGGDTLLYDHVLTFADDAAAPITISDGPIYGSYKPTSGDAAADVFPSPAPAGPYNDPTNATFASTFNGTQANGAWSLYVADDILGDSGSIPGGWTLSLTTARTAATNFSNTAAIALNDMTAPATPYGSTISISGVSGVITRLTVKIMGLSHARVKDVDIVLITPEGQEVPLLSDAGNGGVSNADLTFDDTATAGVPASVVSGTYKPTDLVEFPQEYIDYYPDPAPPSFGTFFGNPRLSRAYTYSPNGEWKLYVVDDTADNSGVISGGWSMDMTVGPAGPGPGRAVNLFDFSLDGKTDVAVWRPSDRTWYNLDILQGNGGIVLGQHTDKPVPADYNGDAACDSATWRPSTGAWRAQGASVFRSHYFVLGESTDIPAPADYDGDRKADLTVFRPSTGDWHIRKSTDNSIVVIHWGATGDVPVPSDYDADGKADIAIFRQALGDWYVLRSSDGGFQAIHWGAAGDKPVPGDYDGDGKADYAIYRPSIGGWYYYRSTDGNWGGITWGQAGDIAVPGDYDGDAKYDFAVWRPSDRNWYIVKSSDGGFIFRLWGLSNDMPVPSSYQP